MVVLSFRRWLFLIAMLSLFGLGCTKDRLIDIAPIIYPVEYWKKDSLVYRLLEGEEVLTQQSTIFGVSSPDTLSLFFEDNRFIQTYLEENKNGGIIDSVSGVFAIDSDSLYLYFSDTIKQKIVSKEDSVMILETSLTSGPYLREYREYYQLLDIAKTANLISFRNDIYDPIFYNNGKGKCMPCHNANGGQMNLVPSSLAYSSLKDGLSVNDGSIPYIDTDNPEASYLYRLVANDNVKYAMPPNSSLTPYEVDIILEWIAQGADNN